MLQTSTTAERHTTPPRTLRRSVPPDHDLRAKYRKAAQDYRRDDEIEVHTDHHCWIWKTLADVSSSFEREISALDAGCGTGRHFHCLANVNRLVGVDLSPEMLRVARMPIRREMICARQTELVCGDIREAKFPPGTFDLIYSLGMFGYGCELTADLLDRFHEWLAPGGLLFFDISDSSGVLLDLRVRGALRRLITPLLPSNLRQRFEERRKAVQFHHVSRRELMRLLRQSLFADWEIYRRPCHSPCWSVDKLECVAAKDQLGPELVDTLRFRASTPAGV